MEMRIRHYFFVIKISASEYSIYSTIKWRSFIHSFNQQWFSIYNANSPLLGAKCRAVSNKDVQQQGVPIPCDKYIKQISTKCSGKTKVAQVFQSWKVLVHLATRMKMN